jgi:hypothetical protein
MAQASSDAQWGTAQFTAPLVEYGPDRGPVNAGGAGGQGTIERRARKLADEAKIQHRVNLGFRKADLS